MLYSTIIFPRILCGDQVKYFSNVILKYLVFYALGIWISFKVTFKKLKFGFINFEVPFDLPTS
jgi:hypothetical protein